MAFIDIYTNNLSRELRNNRTYADNYVFVPGTAITGDPDKIHVFETLRDFQNTCGTHGPDNDSRTYEYVAGILSAGLPVLFKRITKNDKDAENVQEVKKAFLEVTHTDSTTNTPVKDIKIQEKYGGSFGNELSVVIRKTDTAYFIDVYLNEITLLESNRIITYNTSEQQSAINQRLIDALQSVNGTGKNDIQFERIDIDVITTDPAKFNLQTSNVKQPLHDGEDLDEDYVADMIPELFSLTGDLADKVLYQPKFLTSGGYTDAYADSNNPIATAMKELSKFRQDCRALIDLPIDTDKNDQQKKAAEVAYTQGSNTQDIPSASVCAPWCYMQVGTEQKWMPASYAYLQVVGNAVSRGGNAYTPKAGLSNGIVPNVIRPQFEIGSDVSTRWQQDGEAQINPIMRLQGGAYVIAGNSTLLRTDANANEENAFAESSADLTVIEIRRFVYNLATELQYQYNGVTAFETFSLRTAKFLDAMVTEGAVTKYDIENISSDENPRTLKVRLDVYLTPTIKNIEIYLNISYGSIEVITGGVE